MPRERLEVDADLHALHRRFPDRYPFLLESVAGHPLSGRWDLLFAAPGAALASRGGQLLRIGDGVPEGQDFFEVLDDWQRSGPPVEATDDDLPFTGGWFLLVGYEMAARIEPRLCLPASPFSLPDALAIRCRGAVLRDRLTGETWLVAEDSAALMAQMRQDLESSADDAATRKVPQGAPLVMQIEEEPPARFTRGVERILEYLRAGDAFQVNLSRAWRGRLAPDVAPSDLYEALRSRNPAPFAGVARWQGATVLSSSPERLVEIRGPRVQTRPIAGTRPRGADPDADRRLREQLIRDSKERAEHIMLIDLERNDLGRVCLPGSVEVSELMTVESYAHVHHLVSNVRGALRPGVGAGAVLRAVFPGGTITGCPKVRAMEIIAELEGVGRGPYTGAMGYLGIDGRLDANILIRSFVCEDGQVTLRAGAGIVSDSTPARELEETHAKARGLLATFGMAS